MIKIKISTWSVTANCSKKLKKEKRAVAEKGNLRERRQKNKKTNIAVVGTRLKGYSEGKGTITTGRVKW